MTQRFVKDSRMAQLPSLGPARLASIVSRTADDPGRWLDLVRFDPDRRWYQRLDHADDYELWLLSWLPGQQTGFHDHGASAGAFTVALGVLSERGVNAGRPQPSPRTIRKGAVRAFGPGHVHDVRNDATQSAVSIHAYSPPLVSMRSFEASSGGLLRVVAEERSW
jgi:predicted metal-dependent enzyme (double-stranded beta helix superfamily)